MTVRFLLIKHLSLGFGVLLKRESADVGKIYFAESQSSKSVSLSHPYLSVAEGLTLSKFVSLGLFEGLFDEQTKERGRETKSPHQTIFRSRDLLHASRGYPWDAQSGTTIDFK